MSHTPGPWRVDEDGFVWGCCPGPAFMKTAHFLVAEVRGWGYLQYQADGVQTQSCNARLIAAAPELYEALEAAYMVLKPQKSRFEEYVNAVTLARAALAKARGEEGIEG